jgi:hypothetical protein
MLLYKLNASSATFRDLMIPGDTQDLTECRICSAVVRKVEQHQHKLFHDDLRSLVQEVTRVRQKR